MISTINNIRRVLDDIQPVVDYIGKQDILLATKLLKDRIENPKSYVTVVGETSSGKSTIINGFLKNDILPTSASPTTNVVVEVELSRDDNISYCVVNKDGSKELISLDLFKKISQDPNESVARLCVRYPAPDKQLIGLSIFDTPGYNSINPEHEEILKEFITNSDAIVFVSGYRQGFGQYDKILLEIIVDSLKDDPDIPFFLIINRVPSDMKTENKRVQEIVKNFEGTLNRKVLLYLTSSCPHKDAKGKSMHVLPESDKVWIDVKNVVLSGTRQRILFQKLIQSTCIILNEVYLVLSQIKDIADVEEDDIKKIESCLDEYASKEKKSLKIIEETFSRLNRSFPKFIKTRLEDTKKNILKSFDNFSSWSEKAQCLAFVENHLLPYEILKAGKDIENYIYIEIEKLNKQIEDMANTAMRELEKSLSLSDIAIQKVIDNIVKRIANKILDNSAKSLSATLKGGVGGYASGVGNLVKMAVSRISKLFGKTLSRNVYTKIGKFFNKTRTAVLIQLAVDGVLFIGEVITFKDKLKSNVIKVIDKWEEEINKQIMDWIILIKEETIKVINEVYSDIVKEMKNEITDVLSNKKYEVGSIEVMMKKIEDLKLILGGCNER